MNNVNRNILIVQMLVVLMIELMMGDIAREKNIITQDVIDVCFVFINVCLVVVYVCCQKIPYKLMRNIYFYAVASIMVAIVAYYNPIEFMDFFRVRDANGYHYGAISQLHGINQLHADTYTKLLAMLYGCFGESYRIGVGVNIVVSIISILFFYKTLKFMKINIKTNIFITSVFMFLPWKWEFSLFPLREAFPTCLISISLFFFIKWYFGEKYMNVYVAIIVSLCAMMFHSGLIFIPSVYVVSSVIYNPTRKRLEISYKTIRNFTPIVLLAMCLCYVFSDEIFSKFPTMEFVLDEAALSNYSDYWTENDAGSAYLQWLSYGSIQDVIIQSPLRALYFALAPVPWEWRGIVDMFAFITDAGIHIYIYYYVMKNREYVLNEYKILMNILMIIFILEIFMYGATTYNSGTALRHRAKIEILLFIIYSINANFKISGRSFR